MPTYVYACDACGKQFEQFQSFKDEPLRTCPCGKEGSVRRVFQPVGIVFKGSGWYITDSRKSDSAAVSSAASGEPAKSEGSTPAPAAEAKPAETKPAETKSSSETTSSAS